MADVISKPTSSEVKIRSTNREITSGIKKFNIGNAIAANIVTNIKLRPPPITNPPIDFALEILKANITTPTYAIRALRVELIKIKIKMNVKIVKIFIYKKIIHMY